MVAPNNKQKILNKLLALSKVYPDSVPEDLSVLDHLLIGVIQENTNFSSAQKAYKGLVSACHNFNELRVSHRKEIESQLEGIPHRGEKAKRILSILQFVFETTYTFDLESMRKKPLKQAQKQLSKITGASEFAVSATVQRALSGHSLPVDACGRALLLEIELIAPEDDSKAIKNSLEHLVPKAKGVSFSMLVSELASEPDEVKKSDHLEALLPKSKRIKKEVEETPAEPPAAMSKTSAPKKTAKKK